MGTRKAETAFSLRRRNSRFLEWKKRFRRAMLGLLDLPRAEFLTLDDEIRRLELTPSRYEVQ